LSKEKELLMQLRVMSSQLVRSITTSRKLTMKKFNKFGKK